MHYLKRLRVVWMLVAIVTTLVTRTAGAAAPTHAPECGTWNIVPSPSPYSEVNYLIGVTAISANDVWAVGDGEGSKSPQSTLTEHWDGSSWSVVPSPNGPPQASFNTLFSVSGTSANDVWAVGGYDPPTGGGVSLIEHWDGKHWRVVPSPDPGNPGHPQYYLGDVAAISANDAWAGGAYQANGPMTALIEHWDGKQWKIVPYANPRHTTSLSGITALSANDIWAVGNIDRYTPLGSILATFSMHWDGKRWRNVYSPNEGTFYNSFTRVAGDSTNDIWAVGYYSNIDFPPYYHPVVEHWNGTRWSVVRSPQPGTSMNGLVGVAAIASSDAWAVGDYIPKHAQYPQTQIDHWDGRSWTLVPSPHLYYGTLYDVAATSAKQVWAVGYQSNGSYPGRTLIEFYC